MCPLEFSVLVYERSSPEPFLLLLLGLVGGQEGVEEWTHSVQVSDELHHGPFTGHVAQRLPRRPETHKSHLSLFNSI